MSSVASIGRRCIIRRCVGVEDSGIKEILGFDVESCAFLSICATERESLSSQQLESGFDTNVGAYLCEKLCSDVSDSVVLNGRHGTLWAAERMANTKWLTTWAVCGYSLVGVQPNSEPLILDLRT